VHRRFGVQDTDICKAIKRPENGSIDARLGTGFIKQRIARHRKGKSGGFRAIIFLQKGLKGVTHLQKRVTHLPTCLYLFPKNTRQNAAACLELEQRLSRSISQRPAGPSGAELG
jgi:hypothetical protein